MLCIVSQEKYHPLKLVKDYCETYSSLRKSYKSGPTYPLCVAVKSGKYVVYLLLYAGAEANLAICNNVGRYGDISTMQLLLSHNGLLDMTMIRDILCSASYYGNVDMVRFLIRIPDVPLQGQPLSLACQEGHVPVVRLLLHAGADPNSGYGKSLYNAVVYGHLEVVRLLLDAGVLKGGALGRAAKYGHVDIVRYLLDIGVDPKDNNDAALCNACRNEHTEIVRILMEETDSWNPKALRWAILRENIPIVRMLLYSDHCVYDEKTSQMALEKDNKEIISLLQNYNLLEKK